MGFGWLLCGYFISTFMTFHGAGNFVRLLGYGIIIVSAKKLRRYHDSFTFMEIGAILMLCVAGILAASDVTGFLYDNLILDTKIVSDGMRDAIGYMEQIVSLIFQSTMLFAIRSIAKETEVKKVSDGAIRNFVFLCMYYFAYAINLLVSTEDQKILVAMAGAVWILYFACILLNHWLIFSAYAQICDEEDLDLAQKPSRFAFVNRFREKTEEKNQRARAEYEA
ncbi:MAG: hypothetical protein IKA76_08985, partial [Clostridia bacterium]|nr:hypothetical protein [Clostridia bacterium]